MTDAGGEPVSKPASKPARTPDSSEFHLQIEVADAPVVDLLAEACGLSRQAVRRAMDKGAVWSQRGNSVRRVRRRTVRLAIGDQLHLYHDPAVLAAQPLPATRVEDLGRYSVWDKPPGMRSQGSRWGDHTSLPRWAEKHLQPQRPAYIVHRLDRAASGLMLLAHNKKTAAALAQRFRERRVDKRYRVEVHGSFPAVDEPLLIDSDIDGRHACSRARRLSYDADGERSLLEVAIETGRKHQIRRHLAGVGYPVIGDRLYGPSGAAEDLRLRAYRLRIECPLSGTWRVFEIS